MHIHAYEEREPTPRNDAVLNRLAKRPMETFETVEDAVAWHAHWIEDNPRPASHWGLHESEEEGKRSKVDFTRHELERGGERVDFYWSGQHVMLLFIPCPAREIPGFPKPPPCPLGRNSDAGTGSTGTISAGS